MEDFEIPIGRVPPAHTSAVFAMSAFQEGIIPEESAGPLSEEDIEWVHNTVEQGQKTEPAPSPVAERYLRNAFSQYDFDMPVTQEQWQNYVLTQWYRQSQDPDPKVSKSALDSLAKSSVVNLMVEKKEISITTKSDDELNQELKALFASLKAKTIEGKAERVPNAG
jgi:hypothetical protein